MRVNSVEIIGLRDLGYAIPECEETGKTFSENALLKVTHTRKYLQARHRQSLVIGDDSGMSIHALKGEPGVHTRRWTGKVLSDEEIINYCLDQLKAHNDRAADYITAYAISEPNFAPYIIQEKTRGEILNTPRRESYVEGLPFRCLFYMPSIGAMFHEARELSVSRRKNIEIGHEIALDKCRSFIETSLELSRLKDLLAASWSAKTGYYPQLQDKPSTGQCAVSALLIQDFLGGELIKCTAVSKHSKETHFFNRLLDGWEVDLTSSQFPKGTRYENKIVADRNEILSYASTVKRYNKLKDAFYRNLGGLSPLHSG